MTGRKLMVLFPGRNYSCDKPLLYYAGRVFKKRGYEILPIEYNTTLTGDKDDIPRLIEESYAYAEKILDNVDFSAYDDVVFVSKSIGTAVAGRASKKYEARIRHIYLTPVAESLIYMERGTCIVVAGKEDRLLPGHRLKIFCAKEDIALKQFEEVGHSLEHYEDMSKTFAILMVIIRLYKEF